MDTKAILHTKVKLNELASQHNRLTTLCAFLLNEVTSLKKELSTIRSGDLSSTSVNELKSMHTQNNTSNTNFSELKAEEILKQLSINNTDM
jgi:hypothetical protein